MGIAIIDFDDSFTFNIASTVSNLFPTEPLKIYHWQDQSLKNIKNSNIVILGPGPGRPSEYSTIYPLIESLLRRRDGLLYGVCLGHQMIGEILGYQLGRARKPIHGMKRTYKMNTHWKNRVSSNSDTITVQHYNSLCLEAKNKNPEKEFSVNGEVLMLEGKNYFSCQFHPESIATDNTDSFFYMLEKYL